MNDTLLLNYQRFVQMCSDPELTSAFEACKAAGISNHSGPEHRLLYRVWVDLRRQKAATYGVDLSLIGGQ